MTPIEPPRDPHYHFMTDMTNHAVDWVRAEKSLTPDKPFFIYFAPGATHAPHHVPKEWIEKYRGQVRPGLGQGSRGDARAPEGARRRAARHGARAQAQGDQGLGFAQRRRETSVRAADGGVRRLRRICRHGNRPADLGYRRARPARQHARLLHHRRQRRERRRRHERALQREHLFQPGARKRRGHPEAHRRTRRAEHLSPLLCRLGGGGRHALHLDQADRVELRRHAKRSCGPLAEGDRSRRTRSARSGIT